MRRWLSILLAVCLFASSASCAQRIPKNSVQSEKDLQGKTIGVLLGSAGQVYSAQYGNARTYNDGTSMLGDLVNGTLDCIIADATYAKNLTGKESRVKILPDPLVEESFCYMIPKEDADLMKAVNSALDKLSANGTLQKIIDGYINKTSQTYTPPKNAKKTTAVLTLALDASFPPYEFAGSDGQIAGLDIDVTRAICDILGVDFKVMTVDSGKLMDTVQSGKADFAVGGVTRVETDKDKVNFSNSYTTCRQVIIVRRK